MKKPAFEIAIASIVLSTNVVAQQPIMVPNNNMSGGMINPQFGGSGTISGMSGGMINPQSGGSGTISGMSGGMINPQSGGSGTMSGMSGGMINPQSGGMNSSMKHLPGVNAAQLQAQRAVSVGAVATPMGMAQAYRLPNSPTTYYVLQNGAVYSQ